VRDANAFALQVIRGKYELNYSHLEYAKNVMEKAFRLEAEMRRKEGKYILDTERAIAQNTLAYLYREIAQFLPNKEASDLILKKAINWVDKSIRIRENDKDI